MTSHMNTITLLPKIKLIPDFQSNGMYCYIHHSINNGNIGNIMKNNICIIILYLYCCYTPGFLLNDHWFDWFPDANRCHNLARFMISWFCMDGMDQLSSIGYVNKWVILKREIFWRRGIRSFTIFNLHNTDYLDQIWWLITFSVSNRFI